MEALNTRVYNQYVLVLTVRLLANVSVEVSKQEGTACVHSTVEGLSL
jgi:hypothetical protein